MDTNAALVQIAQVASHAAQNAQSGVIWNTVITSVLGFLGVVVTTIGAMYLASINSHTKTAAQNSQETKAAVVDTNAKQDAMMEKTVEIHTATNGNLAKMQTALDVLQEKNNGLEKLIVSMIDASRAGDVTLARLRSEKDVAAAQPSLAQVLKDHTSTLTFTDAQIDRVIEALKSQKQHPPPI